MASLTQRQKKIATKRMQTPLKQFLKEIASRRPVTFHKHKKHISRYPDTKRITHLLPSSEYELHRDSFTEYGHEVASGASFFEQRHDLFLDLPKDTCFQMGSGENTDFADVVRGSKNVYLSNFIVYECENVCYSMVARENCTNIFSSLMVFKNCENIYLSAGVIESFNVFYSKYIKNSSDIWYSKNLIGCHNCINCDGLENKSYCIDNEQLIKELYDQKKHEKIRELHTQGELPTGSGTNFGSNEIQGSFVVDSEHVENGYFSYNTSDSRNVFFTGGAYGDSNFADVFIGGAIQGNNIYAVQGTGNSEYIYCSTLVVNSSNIYYSFGLEDCSFCLGCIGLKNKEYCIFNKQYTKEERHTKVDKIFAQMEQEGTLGDFFPGWMNPFYFNDTAAYLIDDSFTKDEVGKEGYLRRDEEIKVDIPEGVDVISVDELDQYEGWMINGEFVPLSQYSHPDESQDLVSGDTESSSAGRAVRSISPDILSKVIHDSAGNYYRIIPMEYKFLKRHGLPLPRLHWLDRLKMNFKIS